MDSPADPAAVGGAPSGPDVHELLVQCLDALQNGGEAAVEALLAAHPEQAAAVRERLAKLARAGLLPIVEESPAAMPERLGDHRLLRRLGSGGMGVVFLAEQESLGRTVALKMLRPEQRYFPGARTRFRREVEVIARLGDPGIVPIHTVGEDEGVEYFTMEYVRGATLGEGIAALHGTAADRRSGPDLLAVVAARAGMSMPQAVPDLFAGGWTRTCCLLLLRMARAVHHAHERGVVHRDLKPNNAMVTPDGRVLLLDFGLAAASGTERITKSGAVVGTLHYMAPEQLTGGEVDTRTDVYALGVTLYELLTLRPPFDADSAEVLRQRICEGSFTDVGKVAPEVPRDVAVIVHKAMDLDPRRRFQSAQAFAEDLERFLEHRPIHARPASGWTRTVRWGQRHPALATAAALLLVGATLGVLAFEWLSLQSERQVAAAHQRARQNLTEAVAAIESLMGAARSGALSRTPGLDDERQRQLGLAVAMVQRLHLENPDDATVERLYVRGMARAAHLHNLLGRYDDAARLIDAGDEAVSTATAAGRQLPAGDLLSLRLLRGSALVGVGRVAEAAVLWEELLRQHADVTLAGAPRELLLALGTCHNNLGRLYLGDDRIDDGVRELEAAIATERHIPAEQQTVDEQLDFTRTQMNLAAIERERQNFDRADELLAAVAAKLDELAVAAPGEPELVRERARCTFSQAVSALRRGDGAGARRGRDAALASLQQLVADFPARIGYLEELGQMAFEASCDAARSGDGESAEHCVLLAIRSHEDLLTRVPGHPERTLELAEFLRHQSTLSVRRREPDSALRQLERGTALLAGVVEAMPADPHYQVALAALLQETAIHHVRAERWPEALAALLRTREAYERALTAGHEPVLEPRRLPQVLMVLAQVQLMCDDFAGVVAALARLQEVRPMPRSTLRDVGQKLHVDDREDFRRLVEQASPAEATAGTR